MGHLGKRLSQTNGNKDKIFGTSYQIFNKNKLLLAKLS
jgi:hypothetical protein